MQSCSRGASSLVEHGCGRKAGSCPGTAEILKASTGRGVSQRSQEAYFLQGSECRGRFLVELCVRMCPRPVVRAPADYHQQGKCSETKGKTCYCVSNQQLNSFFGPSNLEMVTKTRKGRFRINTCLFRYIHSANCSFFSPL